MLLDTLKCEPVKEKEINEDTVSLKASSALRAIFFNMVGHRKYLSEHRHSAYDVLLIKHINDR